MKKTTPLAIAVAAVLGVASLGCQPVSHTVVPGYTARERDVEIARNISIEGSQLVDDLDRHVFMWRPSGQLSYWNIRKMSH